ncbi:MAG: 50S ribosomal protein L4, partial [bacterium]|nr:50S ribosomal protein L4 [bacterium]
RKFKEGEVLFVDSLALSEPKTKIAIVALGGLSGVKGFSNIFSKRKSAVVLALATKNKEIERAFGNLGNVLVLEARNLDLLTLLQYKYLVLENPEVSIATLPKLSKARTKSLAPRT